LGVERSTWKKVIWPGLVALGSAAPLVAVLAAGRTLVWGDTAVLFWPVRSLVVDAIREFRMPLWNPYEAMGLPLHAQMIHGALHPVSVLTALLAPDAGMDLLIVVNVVLAALGAGILARTLDVSPVSAYVAAIGYGLSGYVLGIGAVLTYQVAAATAPWTIASLRRVGNKGWGAVALASVGVGCLHLAGDPQWTLVAVALGLLLATESGGMPGLGRAATGVVLGTLIGAVQLAPAWAFLEHTARAEGLTAADRVQWALSPWRLIELVSPGLFAGHASENLRAPVYLWIESQTQSRLIRPFVPSVFIGAVPIFLAVLGVRTARVGRWLGVASIVALWLALGHHAGAQQLLQGVPIWSSFRYAEKIVGPMTLCIVVLAALGTDRLRQGSQAPRGRIALLLATVGVVAGVALLVFPVLETFAGTADGAAALARRSLGYGLLYAGGGLATLGTFLFYYSRMSSRQVQLPWLAVAITFSTCCIAAPFALHAGVRGIRDNAPLAGIRTSEVVTRIATPVADPPYPNPLQLGPADLDLAVRSRMGVAPFNVLSRIDQVDVYTGLTPRRVIRFAERLGPDVWTALRRFGLTHVVVKQPHDEATATVARVAVEGGIKVQASEAYQYEVWAVPHRAWAHFAPKVLAVGTGDEALETLAAYELAGFDVAVVEGHPSPGTSSGRILAVQRDRERLRIDAETSGPAFLVVNDAYWPGWKATIDGGLVPVFRTDFLVRGVPFPSGRHVLEMHYEPYETRLGCILAAIGAVVTLALALRGGRSREATSTPSS